MGENRVKLIDCAARTAESAKKRAKRSKKFDFCVDNNIVS